MKELQEDIKDSIILKRVIHRINKLKRTVRIYHIIIFFL